MSETKVNYDLVVVGGGPAGLAAACAACEEGIRDILILERNETLGGILKQCIHHGFGLDYFGKDLTGPEYAAEFIARIKEKKINYKIKTTVLNISPDKQISAVNSEDGLLQINAKSIILAMGCRERPAGALAITGTRPAGVITAGTAQKLMNIDGFHVGSEIVILGSGDIGLIMARRLTLEGRKVIAVIEQMPYSNGLTRNVVQCLEDYNIPLWLSHTVTEIYGGDRVQGVKVSRVGPDLKPIVGTDQYLPCDTLLLSVGLIPENELSKRAGISLDSATGGPIVTQNMETTVPGIFACGNAVQVHDLVDDVSEEGELAGKAVAAYINRQKLSDENPSCDLQDQSELKNQLCKKNQRTLQMLTVVPGEGQNKSDKIETNTNSFDAIICIICPLSCQISVNYPEDKKSFRLDGFQCQKGKEYACKEITNPVRQLATTLPVNGDTTQRVAVRTSEPIPKDRIFQVMSAVKLLRVKAPVKKGQVLEKNILDLGVDIIASGEAGT